MSSRTLIITGAGSGIGAATARLFSKNGYNVVLVGRREKLLRDVADELSTSLVISADLKKPADISKIIGETLNKFGSIELVINNAGVFEALPFCKTDDENWQNILEVNLMGPVRLIREIINAKAGLEVILNVASTAGLRPVLGMTAYTTSKAALIHLTQSLALELAPEKIRVNCVCPGIVDTPIHGTPANEAEKEKRAKQWSQMHPLGRVGTSEDIAHAIFGLCDSGSEWMTGVVLPVDGGISLL